MTVRLLGRYYELEELIALYLREIGDRAEARTGQVIDGVVLGRPMSFVGSGGEADNQRAESRRRRASSEAGFREVAFELEPVAAALYYEATAIGPQNIVVFDLGGGTLDITVMHVAQPGKRQVFATGGLDVAGDSFDRRIIQWRMLDHFGRGSTWGEDPVPFPSKYTDALVDWQAIPELSRPDTFRFLETARMTSSHPERIKALESLLVNNYAIWLFHEVERAKVALSTAPFHVIRLTGDGIDVWEPITRSQFESIIAADRQRIASCLRTTLERSGLAASEIDAVVRTGGSAQIPTFVEMLTQIFGREKIVLADAFSSVTAGLAIRAATGMA